MSRRNASNHRDMRWSFPEVRRLLAMLGDPEIEYSPLALELKDALGTDSARDAVLHVIHKTFDGSSPQNRLARDAILMPALGGDKGTQAASMLNVSLRTFFRRRAGAMKLVAATIEHIMRVANPRLTFKLETARMIAEVRPTSVKGIIERESQRTGGMASYQAVLIALRSGHTPSSSLVNRCTGHWRLLAELEISRSGNLSGRDPSGYQKTRASVREALGDYRGAARERIEFELACVDRLDALRRCDVDLGAQATAVLSRTSGQDVRLRAIATICRAEQACDEGRLAAADSLVRDMQELSVRLNDFRVAGRTSHVASILNLLQGNYAEAVDCSQFAISALQNIEPTFAPCAAAIEGRAQFFLDKHWDLPTAIVRRFPDSYITAFLESVHARYIVSSDARAALAIADQAASIGLSREARGTLLYADATRSIVFERLGRVDDAQAERIRAWSNGVRLRRPFYLYDFLIHPTLPVRAFGGFELDDAFLTAIERRLGELLGNTDSRRESGIAIRSAVAACLSLAANGGRDRKALAQRGGAATFLRRSAKREKGRVHEAFRQLSVELSYCLPIGDRADFIKRFSDGASDVLGYDGPERSVPIGA
ncbi:MAG TPA: hypothetical protein VID24_04260 [Candidatus Eremiobacteraceae bacterium]|jgi:hypothetical protein